MKRNIELLETVMQHILDHPEQHFQSQWWCGTGGCFAGWTLALSGYGEEELKEMANRSCSTGSSVASRAQALLGLTQLERYRLFAGTLSKSELQLMVKDLVNGEELKSVSYYQDEVESQ